MTCECDRYISILISSITSLTIVENRKSHVLKLFGLFTSKIFGIDRGIKNRLKLIFWQKKCLTYQCIILENSKSNILHSRVPPFLKSGEPDFWIFQKGGGEPKKNLGWGKKKGEKSNFSKIKGGNQTVPYCVF